MYNNYSHANNFEQISCILHSYIMHSPQAWTPIIVGYIAVLKSYTVVKVRILTGLVNAMLQQFVQKSLSYNIRSVG